MSLSPLRRLPTAMGTLLLVACALVATALPGPARADDTLTVFAAASLKEALEEVSEAWTAQTGAPVRISFAGSSALARQISAGAPADLFISANSAWMDVLDDAGLLRARSRIDLLRNSLVLIAPADQAAPFPASASAAARPPLLGAALDLPGMLGSEGRLAMALVDAVPAGIYGKAALQSLGLWQDVDARVAQTDNVRAALALVSTGEAPLGIVYATDALADPGVKVLGRFPDDSHPPIVYPAAIMAETRADGARAYLDFLSSPPAAAVFERHGFGLAR
ncbi:molybdate ABC transporter substrate-binding protein [Brevirhabdus sp.]|uniref:molybdate ABC transporter substrate-binding protein n=1 Tax=Brevirhabdus sp. TaxID=2004514 RepID=UPI004057F617